MSVNRRNSRARLVLDLGTRLVESIEHAVCGLNVTSSPAAAEGLALSGVRAAAVCLGEGFTRGAAGSGPAFVVHSDRFDEGSRQAPVVLAAGSHQAAADHCLVAHALATLLRCRVDALVDPGVANSFGRAHPPSPEQILDLLGDAESVAGDSVPSEALLGPVFDRVASVLGRPCGPVRRRDGAKPKAVFLTAGFPEALLSPSFEVGDPPASRLSLELLRPLPVAAVAAAIAPGKPLVVLIPSKSPIHLELLHGLSEAAAEGLLPVSEVRGLAIDNGIQSTEQLAALLREHLPADLGSIFDGAPQAAAKKTVGLRIAAAPASDEAERLLLVCGADLAPQPEIPNDVRLLRHGRESVSLEIGGPGEGTDLLLLQPGRRVDLRPAVRALRPEGEVLLRGEREDPSATWALLPQPIRAELLERKAKIWWIGAAARTDLAATLRSLAKPLRDRRTRGKSDDTREGATPARELDAATLETAMDRSPRSAAVELPRTPRESEDFAGSGDWSAAIREFHLTGRRPVDVDLGTRVFPAISFEEANERVWRQSFPLFLPPPQDAGDPEPLAALLERLCGDMGESSVLKRLLPFLAELADGAARTDCGIAAVLATALEGLTDSADLSDAGRRRLTEELEELQKRVPPGGEVVPFAPSSWWRLYRWAANRGLKERRADFAREIERLTGELEAVLEVDRGLLPQSRTAHSLRSSLGAGGPLLVDPEKLAASVPRRRGSTPLDDERRARIARTLSSLRSFLERWRTRPEIYRIQPTSFPPEDDGSGAVVVKHEAPFELAQGLFAGFAAELVEAARAVRVGQLETTGDFDPERHQPIVDRMSWESLSLEELAILPRIVVLESSRRLSASSLTDFHRLVRSGRPIQVIVRLDEGLGEEGSDPPPDMAYLGMAHREVFILQSGLGDWSHLLEGFRDMLGVPGPAVALAVLPKETESPADAWLRWTALRDSRSAPLCRYDSRKGVSWAERFSLEGNPHPDRPALARSFRHLNEEGAETTTEETCTFAHAAALDPPTQSAFMAIPRAAWSPDQVPLSLYLAEYADLPPDTIPFIEAVDERGFLRRAVVTREMAHACRDRDRAWKVLQELAGWNNPHVERAVETVRKEVLAEAELKIRNSLDAAREEGAKEAIDRLVALLANPELAAPIPAPSRGPAPPRPEAVAPSPPVEEPKPPKREEEAVEEGLTGLDDPYIDSFLCTSCNDCINLNPRMFKYNHDRQAFIADASAGTYRELVKAAEICPAHCIHPGAPRAGDETATADVMERAKALR